MNVFMDNTFLSTSELKKTAPGDELSLFLGPDSEISVEFKEEQFNESKGIIITKSKLINFKHTLTIKNTKPSQIEVSIFQQCPQSNDEKLKVTVIKPNLKEVKDAILNEFNNVRWILQIPSEKKQVVLYHYTVEYPNDKEIQFHS